MKHTRWELEHGSRESLDEAALLGLFDPPAEFKRQDVLEALHLVAKESEILLGQLRPTDRFDGIFKRLPVYNPLRWWWLENKIAARQENLEYAVWGRMKKLGMPKNRKTINTVKDYVMLWCGKQL